MTVKATTVNTEVLVNGEPFLPTDMTVNLRMKTATSKATVTGVSERLPYNGDDVVIRIGGDGTTSTPSSLTTVFEGTITSHNVVTDTIDQIEFEASHTTQNDLSTYQVNKSYEGQAPEQALTEMLRDSPVPSEKWEVNVTTGRLLNAEFDYTKRSNYATDVIGEITSLINAQYWYAPDDTLIIQDPTDIPIERGRVNTVNLLTEVDAGTELGSKNSVVVIGESPTSTGGRDEQHMFAENRPRAIAGEGEPRLTVRDTTVKTIEEAENRAETILGQIKLEQRNTKVTTVGFADVLPMTVAILPPKDDGFRETYLVVSVTHELSSSNGYLTTFHSGQAVEAASPEEVLGMSYDDLTQQAGQSN